MYADVIEVSVAEHLSLNVTFNDGLTGKIRFFESHLTGVFEVLKSPEIFRQVSCVNGYVEWPGEIDLAPDAMYDEIKKCGVWELT